MSTPADVRLPNDWAEILAHATRTPSFERLFYFVQRERKTHLVYPPPAEVMNALRLTSFAATRVLILGQDPYHGEGQANGLAFSVRRGVRVPPSLRNIHQELARDLGLPLPSHGDLSAWAERGVLLLNTSLTVRAGEAASHSGQGWEAFTDAIIAALNGKSERVVFVLWGAHARKKKALISGAQHVIVESGHPSPLSVRYFAGTRPFSKVNAALTASGLPPIDWRLPE